MSPSDVQLLVPPPTWQRARPFILQSAYISAFMTVLPPALPSASATSLSLFLSGVQHCPLAG
eukprot:12422168-Alexandrium_andersonii.AAC.1